MDWMLAPGDVLAHYRVISPLGSGGMGQVYLAEDVRLGRKLALKVLPPRSTTDGARVGRFEREARSISALNHPNIITIYDTGEERGSRFIATEFIDGMTLRHAARPRPARACARRSTSRLQVAKRSPPPTRPASSIAT